MDRVVQNLCTMMLGAYATFCIVLNQIVFNQGISPPRNNRNSCIHNLIIDDIAVLTTHPDASYPVRRVTRHFVSIGIPVYRYRGNDSISDGNIFCRSTCNNNGLPAFHRVPDIQVFNNNIF